MLPIPMPACGKHLWTLLLLSACPFASPQAQQPLPDSVRRLGEGRDRPKHGPVTSGWLFSDDAPLQVLVETNQRRLQYPAPDPVWQPAIVTLKSSDSILFRDEIAVRARGEFRRDNCAIPNVMLDFGRHQSASPILHARIKVVSPCQYGSRYEDLLLREFLAYRIYALFTERSFRVRWVTLRMVDGEGRRKPSEMPSFLIEDIDDMARRNGCHESDDKPRHPDQTDRQQMTLIALFQYMIGNPDWAVAQGHNIRLIRKDGDSLSRPIAVPYDFDYCGLVNAPYAIPDERLGIADVRTRIYMGPPRNLAEIRHIRGLFQERKEDVRRLVDTLPGMRHAERRDVWRYLEQFFAEIGEKDMDARLSPGGWGYSENNGPRPDGQGPDR
jgi:hypothetical protein